MNHIERSIKIVSKEIETDINSYNHAIKELNNWINEHKGVFNEVAIKGLSMRDIDPDLYDDWNKIILTLKITNEKNNITVSKVHNRTKHQRYGG